MKNVILILVLTLMNINHSNAQRKAGEIFLKNGTHKVGLIKLTNSGNVKYKLNKNSKVEIFKKENIKRIFITEKKKLEEYVYKKVESPNGDLSFIKVMNVMIKGDISLYNITSKSTASYIPGSGPGNTGGFYGGGGKTINYYLGRKGNENVVRITSKGTIFEKNFKKAIKAFFKDCPEIVKRIDNGTYKKRDLKDIVLFYNENCG